MSNAVGELYRRDATCNLAAQRFAVELHNHLTIKDLQSRKICVFMVQFGTIDA